MCLSDKCSVKMNQVTKPEGKSEIEELHGKRSIKQSKCITGLSIYQKENFMAVKEKLER